MKITFLLLSAILAYGCTPGPQDDSPPTGTSEEMMIEESIDTKPALDLSRDLLEDAQLEHAPVGDDPALLEDLFEAEKEAKKVKLSGNVLTDEEATQLTERIEGAELKVEIKTK